MKNITLLMVTFMVTILQIAHSAYIPLKTEDEGIKSNLIEHGGVSIEGLEPPKAKAQDHYNSKSPKSGSEIEHPYIVEVSRYYLKLQTSGFPPHIIKLTDKETEEIQKLSLAFVELLINSKLSQGSEEDATTPTSWEDLNPVITLTNSGLTVRFENEPSKEENAVETNEDEKVVVWDFLTKYAKNVFNEKIKEFKINEKDATILESEKEDDHTSQTSNFKKFIDAIWKIMRFSVDYAESNYGGWIKSETEKTTTEVVKDESRGTIATFFAYEEPAPYHEFPSMEFDKRLSDIGSIFYGRGII